MLKTVYTEPAAIVVIDTAAGDLGSSAARKFDCEAWLPTQQRWMEVTSTSNCTTYQARRLAVRERREGGTSPVATLNGTLATTRWMVAILENHQQADGSVRVPAYCCGVVGLRTGYGRIGGAPAVVIVQDFTFMGGSLGMAAGEAFITAAQEAVKRGVPLVCFTAAGGARMQEGALSLMQMARTTLAIQDLKAAQLPYAVVLTDPTTGGVTASYAMLGDVHLAEPGALIGFAGPRVIEATIREKLPPGFQRAEYLQEKGMVDRVVSRGELPHVLGQILSMLMGGAAQKKAA